MLQAMITRGGGHRSEKNRQKFLIKLLLLTQNTLEISTERREGDGKKNGKRKIMCHDVTSLSLDRVNDVICSKQVLAAAAARLFIDSSFFSFGVQSKL